MTEDTIVIKIRDRDPLLVDKQRLIESSSVFSYIIQECGQSEHEIEDFRPEIAEMFLTLLDDKNLKKIEQSDFRELHKISVVFNVEWLIKSCRGWLLAKIHRVGDVIENGSLRFLFDECFYIYSKFNVDRFMTELILKVRFKDNSMFLSCYIRENYDQLMPDQLKFLLYLAGSSTKVLLKLIIERIDSQHCLDNTIRYLLQHMNLSLCVKQNKQLYQEMFEGLSEITDPEDFKLVLKLSTEATIVASAPSNSTPVTTVFQNDEWTALLTSCSSLEDITRLVAQGRINSMYAVIDILAKVMFEVTVNTEETLEFVGDLENLCDSQRILRVSTLYVDKYISALQNSINERQQQFILLLEMIKNNGTLSSFFDNIPSKGERISEINVLEYFIKMLSRYYRISIMDKYVFRLQFPRVSECGENIDCSFILRMEKGYRNRVHRVELSREPEDYALVGPAQTHPLFPLGIVTGTRSVHQHEEIRAERMYFYSIFNTTTSSEDTVRISIPVRWPWNMEHWSRWFTGVVDLSFTGNTRLWSYYCLDYNVRDRLVAKF